MPGADEIAKRARAAKRADGCVEARGESVCSVLFTRYARHRVNRRVNRILCPIPKEAYGRGIVTRCLAISLSLSTVSSYLREGGSLTPFTKHARLQIRSRAMSAVRWCLNLLWDLVWERERERRDGRKGESSVYFWIWGTNWIFCSFLTLCSILFPPEIITVSFKKWIL